MKSGISCFLSVFVIACGAATAHADHHLQLSEELKPLQFLVGNWVLEWEGENGAKMKVTIEREPEAGGHALRESGQFQMDGEQRAAWVVLFFAKSGSQGLATVRVGRRGSHAEGSVTLRDGIVVVERNGITGNGEEFSAETHLKMVNENSYTSQRVNIVVNGEARDDWPVGTFQRVR